MNSAVVGLIAFFLLFLGYKYYGGLIERKVVRPDDSKKTPAHRLYDGQDYSPGKKSLLFGHHFSSIAGAAPIIGPVVAVYNFGWGLGAVWIVVGAIFMGAVHDYLSLMVSVRNDGNSMADVAGKVMGKKSKKMFAIFMWITLVLIITVFGWVAAKTLATKPEIVLPTFLLLPIAMLFGFAVYRLNVPVSVGTISAILLLLGSIYLGYKVPILLPFALKTNMILWFTALMGYALVASVLPVWLLLQPRDYLSTFVLFIGLAVGIAGLLVTHPEINAPVFTGVMSGQGPVWPTLMVLIACGAISGFHSIVSGGTTSKQLDKESDGRVIGYGGMIMESVLAFIALLAVSAGLFWNPPAGMEQFGFRTLFEQKGWIVAFGTGYGRFVEPFIGISLGTLFAMTMLKTFIMTSLDTSTRLARFIFTETFGENSNILKNKWVASFISILPAFILGVTGSWQGIWTLFGASNQLIAALSLIVVSAYLIGVKKPAKYTLIPAGIMLITTIVALLYKIYSDLILAPEPKYFIVLVALVILYLAIVMMREARDIFFNKKINVENNM
ncbi:carbon starvation CstA family protein [Halothermothrix orenii]|uniref:Carbon starvation protein CstA n=1 Tax=Halothermothrix orenii (strain H 168 / OCM 544 / DSM 9562) TaxID=373903 RepID=B8CWY0_HALOH|nr:carbon starvation protein A [Halothermothrix orenii]ACL69799.1 carbon starvation protein CstA [Halothermothrix orenii H 168]